MSDTEAQAQSLQADEIPAAAGNSPENEPPAGSDETTTDAITDIESYRAAIGALQPERGSDEESAEGSASAEETPDEPDGQREEPDGAEDHNDADNAESQQAADTGQKRPPQYRWRPKSEIDALAMDIIKRAEKSGKEITLKDALAQAEAILAPDDAASGEAGPEKTEQAGGFPDNVGDAEKMLADLRAQRKQAFAKDLDFERAAELDEQIEALRDHLQALRNSEAAARQEQEAAWNQALEASKVKAVEMYPDAANPNSALVKKMVEIDALLKETDNDLFFSPEKPLKLAQMAANELGIAPRRPGSGPIKTVVSSKPAKAVRSQLPLASGNARTISNNGHIVADVDSIADEQSWREAVNRFKAAAMI